MAGKAAIGQPLQSQRKSSRIAPTAGIPMGRLTTHVLDTAQGKPAAGMQIALYRVTGNSHKKIATVQTNADGRTDAPLLEGKTFALGEYELVFGAGSYLQSQNHPKTFLNDIPIRFTISEDRHYHVPLLLSPFGYSTYRGS
jgi:5-hydroxyisourate hydrolase